MAHVITGNGNALIRALTIADTRTHTIPLRKTGYKPVTESVALTGNMTISRVMEAGGNVQYLGRSCEEVAFLLAVDRTSIYL